MIKTLSTQLKNIALVIALVLGALATPLLIPSVASAAPADEICKGVGGATGSSQSCGGSELGDIFHTIINILLFVIGLVSVLMIVIGGLRYVLSGGDSSAITGAKNTILYAIIGLIVAVSAYGIVNFVVGRF